MTKSITNTMTNTMTYAIIAGLILGGFGMTNFAFAASPTTGDNLTADQQVKLQAELDKLYEKYDKLVQDIQKQEQEIFKKFNVSETSSIFTTDEYYEDDISSEDSKRLDEIEKAYSKTLAEFGFVEPILSEEKEEQMYQAFGKIDAKYDKIFEQLNDPKISKDVKAKLEKQLDVLDAEYDKIHSDFGFKYPKLTEEQERKLDEKLSLLLEEEQDIYESYGYFDDYEYDEEFDVDYFEYLSPEELKEMEELDAKYAAIYKEFGFVDPIISEQDQTKIDKKLSELDSKYDVIFIKMDDPKTTDDEQINLEKQLDVLDAEYDKVYTDFGFKFPELTEEQEIVLNERLDILNDQYDSFYYDDENYDCYIEVENGIEYEVCDYTDYDYDENYDCYIEVENGIEYEVCDYTDYDYDENYDCYIEVENGIEYEVCDYTDYDYDENYDCYIEVENGIEYEVCDYTDYDYDDDVRCLSLDCDEDYVCTTDYIPVCGIDGITYGNMCELESPSGSELDYVGECLDSEISDYCYIEVDDEGFEYEVCDYTDYDYDEDYDCYTDVDDEGFEYLVCN